MREKIQALSLAKECYGMKLELITNATVIDDAIRFVSEKSQVSEHKNGQQQIGQQEPRDMALTNQIFLQSL